MSNVKSLVDRLPARDDYCRLLFFRPENSLQAVPPIAHFDLRRCLGRRRRVPRGEPPVIFGDGQYQGVLVVWLVVRQTRA